MLLQPDCPSVASSWQQYIEWCLLVAHLFIGCQSLTVHHFNSTPYQLAVSP